MSAVRARLVPSLLRVLALWLLALGPAGAQALQLAAHRTACACAACGTADDAGGCCSRRPVAPHGTVLEQEGCACTPLPARAPSLPEWKPDPSGPKTRGNPALALAGLPQGPAPAWIAAPARAAFPPGRTRGSSEAIAVPRLRRCGGERAAWLGCARL